MTSLFSSYAKEKRLILIAGIRRDPGFFPWADKFLAHKKTLCKNIVSKISSKVSQHFS
jgi:hypothetical protein